MDLERLAIDHQGPLFAFIFRLCGSADLAEELVQETFVRALQASERYRPEASVRTWLFSIAANLVRGRWRRQARWGEPLPLDELALESAHDTERQALTSVQSEQVRAAILHLPLEQRAALILRYFHGLTYLEVAQALACPIGTVRSRIHNGLIRLRTLLNVEVNCHEGD